jgi:hypothetical protein
MTVDSWQHMFYNFPLIPDNNTFNDLPIVHLDNLLNYFLAINVLTILIFGMSKYNKTAVEKLYPLNDMMYLLIIL